LFIANEDDAKISAIDAVSGKLIAEMEVGGEPEGVNLRPDGKEVWVTSENDGAVFVINAAKPEVVQKIPVVTGRDRRRFRPTARARMCRPKTTARLSVIDTATYTVVATITLSGTDQRPMGGAISSDGKFLYMTTGRGKTVAIIDTATNTRVGSVEVGPRPWGVAISQDDKTVFTANGPSNDVSFVDVQSRSVKARVKVGTVRGVPCSCRDRRVTLEETLSAHHHRHVNHLSHQATTTRGRPRRAPRSLRRSASHGRLRQETANSTG
jgi:YVTN family beta-propeller protein